MKDKATNNSKSNTDIKSAVAVKTSTIAEESKEPDVLTELPKQQPSINNNHQKKPSQGSIHENVLKAIRNSSGSPKDISMFATYTMADGQKYSTTERIQKGTVLLNFK